MTWFVFCYWFEPDAPGDPVGLVRIWQLARHLSRRGDRVVTFAPRYRSTLAQRDLEIRPVRLTPIRGLRPLSYAAGSFVAGLLAARRSTPEIVYYRWMESPHLLLLARLLGSTCVCEVNGEPVPRWGGRTGGLGARLKECLARFALRRCDRIVALTDGLRHMVVERYGVAPDRVAVLPSATDTALFMVADRALCRRRLELDPAAEYIGFVGTFYEYQGLRGLLEAFATVCARRPGARLLLVGDGVEAGALKDEATRLGVSGAVIWAGRVPYDEVPVWIGAMDVCAAPFRGDRGETSPVKLHDYLACGRPVVASAIPSVAEAFSDGRGVLLVPPDDPGALAGALLRVLESPDLREEQGRLGRRAVEERHSWPSLVDQLRTWLAQVSPGSGHAHSCLLR